MNHDHRLYRFGDSTLTLEFKNILTSQAQVLVTYDDKHLTMGGGLSATIYRGGGNSIALDAAKKVPVTLGDVAVTTAGMLQAQYIFHAITMGEANEQPDPRSIYEMTTRRCMQLMNVLNVSSIAFPAPPIGFGINGFSYHEAAEGMSDVFADELRHFKRPIKFAIHLCDTQDTIRFDPFTFAEEFARHESQWQEIPDTETLESGKDSNTKVFISYSHKDKKWLKRLIDMLKPLIRKGSIMIWTDTNIEPGEDWKKEIRSALASTKVAVLLVSPNFLASRFIEENELPPLLKSAKGGELTILWVCLSPCLYKERGIGTFQAAHDISKPLKSLKSANRDRALVEVCQSIKAATIV